jgi:hypothetical protein
MSESLQKSISKYHPYNGVKLLRQNFQGTILIVEGPRDVKLFKKFTVGEEFKIIPGAGKPNILEAIIKLKQDDEREVVAVVDADFWRLEKIEPKEPNIIVTDLRDMDVMILSSRSLHNSLIEYGDEEKIKQLKQPLFQYLLEKSKPLTIFRWISSPTQKNYYLTFDDDVKIDDFINKRDLTLKIDHMITIVMRESSNVDLDPEEIKKNIESFDCSNINLLDFCHGHDMTKILYIGLKNIFGNQQAKRLDLSLLEITLRNNYDFSEFSKTKLFESLKTWEEKNSKKSFLIN